MFDNKYPYLEMEKSIWLVKGNGKIREKIGKFKIMQVLKVGTLFFGNTWITCFILFHHVPCRIYIFEFCRQITLCIVLLNWKKVGKDDSIFVSLPILNNIFSNVQINIAIMHIDTKMTSFKTRPTPIFGQYFLGGLG